MITIPPREEWPDADFVLPDGDHIRSLDVESDKDDDDDDLDLDWDVEMHFGSTGAAKAKAVVSSLAARTDFARLTSPAMFTVRPPLTRQEEEDEEDDEGVSTIKVAQLASTLKAVAKPPPIDEDFESAFALPSDLTQLSLAPLPLSHRSSKNSLEWGDRDQTSSSQSSDAYSSLGFADGSSSNSVSSLSLPDTEESECDDDESELDGLVVPSGLFESGHSGKHLKKILESKKKAPAPDQRAKVASPDPEDDFEMGLVIQDDDDFSPSRLISAKQTQKFAKRCKSAPARPLIPTRPPSRMRADRAKSPINPPISSARQLQRIKLSSSPPPRQPPPTRAQTYMEALSAAPPLPTNSFLSPKPGSLRGQKSHSGLKPPTPPSTQRKALTRKASLSSLLEASSSQASGSGTAPTAGLSNKFARYEAPTAASRAKSHTSSTSRIHALEFVVPPTRPSTPSSNPAALRLTMPTSIRMKSRPALSAVFPGPPPVNILAQPPHRATSPVPPRPPSTASLRSRTSPPIPSSSAPKLLRRPKRQRTYGDGTELDAFEDLPTDRDKEVKFRIQPKATSRGGVTNPKSSSTEKDTDKGTLRKKGRIEEPSPTLGQYMHHSPGALAPATNTLRRTGRIEFSKATELPGKKKKDASSPVLGHTRRKPTLIRHLGGQSGPKVVGDMKWNPSTLRWEGNDQVLREFDAVVGTSTRPALITHLTGSSIGSPVGSFASGARKVGNMIFDPTRMCWISTLPPDEDEPDVFADLADDEEDDEWEAKAGTIRASQQQGCASNTPSETSGSCASAIVITAPSPARSRARTTSESESDRGSRASIVYDVADDFVEVCRIAEERHRSEMRGWRSSASRQTDPFGEPDRSYLYEIRALATRKY
ncbi:hypothetical protein L210DRAFT_3392038 [Boletus edulis BED1]|uniref:Protein byr4 n=1 Tax=Boletus edulis BED1 TaxID=1328754 RepID=A0AAD4C215_BOLED|nr:hypothetical protein L210DRAFT_3392038 [Boletus edulis BED1]